MARRRGKALARYMLAVLRRTYGEHRVTVRQEPLEELILGILADGTSERRAATALRSLMETFVDWNEVRVSSAFEIADAMPKMPDALRKAGVIREVLTRVFDGANEMSLEFLRGKSQRTALRLIDGIEGFPESALARAWVLALGNDIFPLTDGVLTVCRRLGLVEAGSTKGSLEDRIERYVPRDRMYEFHWLVSRHAAEVCLPEEPRCSVCGLSSDCTNAAKHSRHRSRRKTTRKKR